MRFSYSLVNTHDEVCPEQCRETRFTKAYKVEYKAVTEGLDLHKAAENYVKLGAALPEEIADVGPIVAAVRSKLPDAALYTEKQFAIAPNLKPVDYWSVNTWVWGTYDVFAISPDTTQALFIDWKTGKRREKADQLELGALLAFEHYPSLKHVVGMNIWLADRNKLGTPYIFTRTSSEYDRQGRENRWLGWIKRIQAIQKKDPSVPWEKRPGPLCGYCPVKSCEHFRGDQHE